MDRSLYPEGVVVDQVDLANTEETRSFNILQRFEDTAIFGLVSGSVTINIGNATLVDVNAFSGYAPNGELVASTSSYIGRSLANYTLGAINYVLAVYTETNDDLKPHETNGNSYATHANRSVRVRVLSTAEYNALPDTDANLNNDAKDRALIIAKVTARGATIALTISDIENATSFNNAISAIKDTNNITGVAIQNIDRTTIPGVGTLQFTIVATVPYLQWKSPDPLDSYGSTVNIGTSGLFTLTSALSKGITVLVVAPSLPGITPLTDNVTLTNIYAQDVNRFSSEDTQHRSFLGTGVPTSTNPHGLTIEDLGVSSGIVETHQDLFHANGILKTSNINLFATTSPYGGVDTLAAPDSLNVYGPVIGDQFYLNGRTHNILQSTNIQFTGITNTQQQLWEIYVVEGVSSVATLERRERIRFVNSATNLEKVIQLRHLDTLCQSGVLYIKYDGTTKQISVRIPGDSNYGGAITVPSGGSAISGYEIQFRSYNGLRQIILYVADQANGNWSLLGAGTTIEQATVFTRPTDLEIEARMQIASVRYSGITQFLGNGFGTADAPNLTYDMHNDVRGTLALDNIREDDLDKLQIANTLGNGVLPMSNTEALIKASSVITVGTDRRFIAADFMVQDYASAALCIQAALNRIAVLGGGTVFIKPGIYEFGDSSYLIMPSNVTLSGCNDSQDPSIPNVIFSKTDTSANPIINIPSTIFGGTIKGIAFQLNANTSTSLMVMGGSYTKVDRCMFISSTAQTSPTPLVKVAAVGINTYSNIVSGCRFIVNNTNLRTIYIDSDGTYITSNTIITDCNFVGNNNETPMRIGGSSGTLIKGCSFKFMSMAISAGLSTSLAPTGINVSDCRFEGCGTTFFANPAIYLSSASEYTVHDCKFNACGIGVLVESTKNGIIHSNIFHDTVASAWAIVVHTAAIGNGRIIIKENIVQGSATLVDAILVEAGNNADVIMSSNIINQPTTGHALVGSATGIIMSNNLLLDVGAGIYATTLFHVISDNLYYSGTQTDIAIEISGGENSISGNVIHSPEYGIISTGINNVISSNVIVDTKYDCVLFNRNSDSDKSIIVAENVCSISSSSAAAAIRIADNYNPTSPLVGSIVGNSIRGVTTMISAIHLGNDFGLGTARTEIGVAITGNSIDGAKTGIGGTSNKLFFADGSTACGNSIFNVTHAGIGWPNYQKTHITIAGMNYVQMNTAANASYTAVSAQIACGNYVYGGESDASVGSRLGVAVYSVAIGNYVFGVGSGQASGGTAIGITNNTINSSAIMIGNYIGLVGVGTSTTGLGIHHDVSDNTGVVVANYVGAAYGVSKNAYFVRNTGAGAHPYTVMCLNSQQVSVAGGLLNTRSGIYPVNAGLSPIYDFDGTTGQIWYTNFDGVSP